MPPTVAAIVFTIGIAILFFLDRGEKSRTSNALWIPTAWLFFCGSRSVSAWLGISSTTADSASIYTEGSPLDRTVFMALEIVALIVVISRRQRVNPILRRNWVFGVFFFYAALSIAWSDFPFVTFKHWIKGFGDVLMVLIVLTEGSAVAAVKRVSTRLGFVLLPVSMLFIKYYPQLGRTLTNSWTAEAVGVSTQKNGLGILCDFFGLGLLWRFRNVYNDRDDPRRRQRLVALGAILAVVVWLLWACNSLTSICALSMGSIVMLLSTRPAFRRKPALVHVVVVAMIALSIYSLFFQSSGGVVENLGRSSTLSGRTDLWEIVLRFATNPVVGAGYESFWLGPRLEKIWAAFPGLKIVQAHNGYIETYLDLGWIGVVLLGVLIATGYQNVIGAYRRAPEVGSLRIAYFLAAVVNAFTEGVLGMMAPPWIFFLLATFRVSWVWRRGVSATPTFASRLATRSPEWSATLPESR